MKSCPVCGRTFPNEYSFCLTDGSPLAGATLAEESTVVRERPVVKRSGGRSILLFVLAVLLSLSLGATAAVLYFFWPRDGANDSPQIASSSPSPAATTTPSPKPERTTSPAPSPTEKPKANVNVPEPPRPPTSDPGTTRIAFGGGRVQQSNSGTVVEERSFVLFARAGQSLSAQVTSPGDCVNFASGDQTLRYATVRGDNRLTIINSCDSPSRFTVTVSIR